MKPKNALPPSRQGKKQVIAYVDPSLAESVREKASSEDKTNQEIIAEAINAFFMSHGREPVFLVGHYRIVRRRKGVSKVRENIAACREGKRAVMGWFDAQSVSKVRKFAKEINLPIQEVLEVGLLHVTGRRLLPDPELD
jgi:hypothetical protein